MSFAEKIKPQGYFDKEDDSLLDVFGLVRGTYNMLITDEWKIATRKGMTLIGQAGSQSYGIKSAVTWQTNTNLEIPLRSRYDTLQALYNGLWQDVATGFKTETAFRYATWWDRTEIKDRLLFVNGTTAVWSWTGGMSELLSWTVNTITKKYAKQSSVANNFVFDATNKTLTQTVDTDFITAGFVSGQKLRIAGTTNNNGIFTINTVTANVITVSAQDTFTNETIATTACMIGVLGRETWAADRFTTSGTKQVVIGGTTFTYTGGENTPTLTGVSTDPSGVATVGGFVYQKVQSSTPTGGDFPSGQIIDLIATNINQVYYGYTKSRNVFLTKQSSFTDCGYTSPVRKAGDGGTIFLDNVANAIATDEEKTYITAGKSDVYAVTFKPFSDGTTSGELLDVKKSKTSFGQGAISQEGVVKIKNGLAYVSYEPTIDFLGNVEQITTAQSKPLSDPIKRLLNRLNNTGVQGVYTKNNLFYLFPQESVLLIFDVERGFWQPPQVVDGNCLSVVGGNVYVHSATKDETYQLFSGLTDNGNPIAHVCYFNIDTYGARSKRKIYDELFIEVLVNGSATNVYGYLLAGYKGSSNVQQFNFGFNDDNAFVEAPALPSGLGTAPFGSEPLGGLFTDPEIDTEIGVLKKIYSIFGTNSNAIEAFTHQFAFSDDESGAYFEIMCCGTNAKVSPTSNVDIMRG